MLSNQYVQVNHNSSLFQTSSTTPANIPYILKYLGNDYFQIYGQESVRRFWGQKDVVVRNKLAVCVRPFFGPYDNARQLIEVIDFLFHTKQGVDIFTCVAL